MSNLLKNNANNNSCSCGCNHNHEHHHHNHTKETCSCNHAHKSSVDTIDNTSQSSTKESCNCGHDCSDGDSGGDEESEHRMCSRNKLNINIKNISLDRENTVTKKKKFILEGLDCAGCAVKIENQVDSLVEVASASLNFTSSTLTVELKNNYSFHDVSPKIEGIVTKLEPHVKVMDSEYYKKINNPVNKSKRKEFLLKGLNCAGCAAKIENLVDSLDKVDSAILNFTTSTLIVEAKENDTFDSIIPKIKDIVLKLEPHVLVLDKSIAGNNSSKANKNNSHSLFDKKQIARLSIGTGIFAAVTIFKFSFEIELIMYILSYLFIGGGVVLSALKNISRGQVFDENFLMVIATFGAFAIKEFPEAVAVMLFYEIGETFQSMAVNRSRNSIADLMDIRPDKANLKIGESLKEVSPEEVNIGDIIVVKPGEKIPLDGVVLDGESMLDTSALTGESVPRKASVNSDVLSGFINKNGVLTIKVKKNFSESAVSKILDLVENAGSKKAKTEKFITKFARYYTPIVVFSALALAVIPPIVIRDAAFSEWFRRALIFLVVSCPCALVVSVPLGFFGGIGCASKNGILIKGGNYLEALNYVDEIVFDKTGTLTKGIFEVTEIKPVKNMSNEKLLEYAAYSEAYSTHPIAKSILKAYGKNIDKSIIKNYSEIAGHGIKSRINGQEVLAGNSKLMDKYNISYKKSNAIGTVVYVSVESEFIGSIIISDQIKTDSKDAIKNLKSIGINKTIMLTGDSKTVGEAVANELGIDKAYTELLPQNKVEILENIIAKSSENHKIAFVGDGVNDAPVLARADVGIAMGGLGSDAAIEAADIVLMTDEPAKLAAAIKIAKNTRKIVLQNIVFALGIKISVLALTAFGLTNMWIAVFADVGVALLAVMNSMRVLKTKV